MSAGWDARTLLEPIAGEQPCGPNPDDTGVLGTFDALRLYGQPRSPEAPSSWRPCFPTPGSAG